MSGGYINISYKIRAVCKVCLKFVEPDASKFVLRSNCHTDAILTREIAAELLGNMLFVDAEKKSGDSSESFRTRLTPVLTRKYSLDNEMEISRE